MNKLRSVGSVLRLVAVVLAAASCAAPVQNGGVVVSPHAEARLDVMCRYRESNAQHVCVEPMDE
jgi:hypothetical protein